MDRFYIAPYDKDSGLTNNVKPWLLPDQAFSQLDNAYVFRGRVRKRFGSTYMGTSQLSSRLRVDIGMTSGFGNFVGITPQIAGAPIVTPAIGQMFSIGNQLFTVNALGNPAPMLISGTATVATYDTTTGDVVIGNADHNTIVYFYPALPVMGLLSPEQTNPNVEPIVGFDTRFAYRYTATGWERIDGETNPGDASWTGDNIQFFWGGNWSGVNAADQVLYVVNFNEAEPNFMRYLFNGTWTTFRPLVFNQTVGPVTTMIHLDMARIIVPFKNRLLAFNTWETTSVTGNPDVQSNYQNRCRYSRIGDPRGVDSWREDVPGRGNAIDAPTLEAIITVEFVKDRLIVFFEKSTWELVYTGNQAYPFAWQQINTELGAEATFSVVPFDTVAIGVGNVGIHACTGSNVQRIDTKIPDEIYNIHAIDGGPERVYGIRDYHTELIYWSVPNTTRTVDFPYPNRVLVYNYVTNTWAYNDDTITVYGYFQPDDDFPGVTQQQVIGGNQEGYTFFIQADTPTNAAVLQITDMNLGPNNEVELTVVDHNVDVHDFIYLNDIVATGDMANLNNTIVQVAQIFADTIIFIDPAIQSGVYHGGGVIARVSKIAIQTKEFNFYQEQGRNASVQRVDFMVDRTVAGKMQVDYYVSTSNVDLQADSIANNTSLGTNILETSPYPTVLFEAHATRLIHPVYFQADGEWIQFYIYIPDALMTDLGVMNADFQMHFMVIYAQPTAQWFQ